MDKNEEEEFQRVVLVSEKVYNNFWDFVLRDNVSKDEFLKDNPMYLKKDELIECFQNVGFAVTDEEAEAVMKHHRADKSGYLLIEDLLANLSCWRNGEAVNNALDKHIDININNLRDRAKDSSQSMSHQSEPKKVKLKIKKTQHDKSKERQFELDEKPKRFIPNKSKEYLKLAKQKEEEEERALAMNIEKCKKELEFDWLHKMSEAWEIAKLLNIPITFSASKGSDGSINISFIQFVDDEDNDGEGDGPLPKKPIKEEITMDEFMREYRKLKRLQNSIKNNSMIKNQQETQVSQNTIVSSYSLNRINKQQRQEELKGIN